MTIVGIDPGTGRCGYAVVQFVGNQPKIITYGCWEFPSTTPLPERYVSIDGYINELLAAHSPNLLAIETLLFNRNITTAMQVSEARGVIVLNGAKRNIPILDCTPLQVKMAITGYGRADKSQVKQMLKLQLKLQETHKLDDALDALGIALTGYHLLVHKKLLQKS